MSGERKNSKKLAKYGKLIMRPYVIFGNDIAAFYDSDDNLVFVLDNTLNARKPNVLLVINSDADKKWDDILSNKYMIDLENIRPKQDNKYQKLDIEYSGLNVYENLIKAYDAGIDLTDYLTQLEILRDSAVRHSAMARLDMANEIISKTNNTIVKTKETIAELQNRLKTLRAKLSAQKKEVGKIPTKQSAAKILRTESQIEATNEKLKRAKKRLESAQRRLDAATNDAELASGLLNQPEPKYATPGAKPVVVAPKYEIQTTEPEEEPVVDEDEEDDNEDDDNDDSVKPLFDSDPNILDEDIAFKPISFDLNESGSEQNTPVVNFEEDEEEDNEEPDEPEETEEKTEDFIAPVSFEPIADEEEPVFEPEPEYKPESESNDMPPIINTQALFNLNKDTESDVHNDDNVLEEKDDAKSVLESMKPVYDYEEKPVVSEQEPMNIRPVEEVVPETVQEFKEPETPIVHPVENTFEAPVVEQEVQTKSKFAYYFLLIVLILLSVFTLWLYQKSIGNNTPVLTSKTEETVVAQESNDVQKDVVTPTEKTLPEVVEEEVFLDEPEETPTEIVEPEPDNQEIPSEEEVLEPEPVEETAESEPEIEPEQNLEEVPEDEEPVEDSEVLPEQEILEEPGLIEQETQEETTEDNTEEMTAEVVVDKPEYDVGSKDEDLFVVEGEENPEDYSEEEVFLDEDEYYEDEE